MNGHRFRFSSTHAAAAAFLALLVIACALPAGCVEPRSGGTAEPAGGPSAPGQGVEEIPLAVRVFFRPLPQEMPGSSDDTPELVALGRRLYFERGISLAKTQACNDCHLLDHERAGVDYQPTSKGAKGEFGKRNAPTVLNAGFQIVQFWDGRAADLAEQAKGPVLNPVEMGMRTEKEVIDQLTSTQGYPDDFARAFPAQEQPMVFDNVARAIAAFERTLITPARFDRYLRGETNALTRAEKAGLQRFMDTGCSDCHNSYPIGGRTLRKFGVYHPYKNEQDLGRYEVTKQEEDKFVFKVPMLRNVTLTPPYFHDGQVSELSEVIRLMAWMQLDTVLGPREREEIIHFLRALEAERPLNIAPPKAG